MKILLIGPPGSGKGSVSELLTKNNTLKHVSTGNFFRAILKEDSELARKIKEINVSGGKLVPDEITNQVAKSAIDELIKNEQSFILDGYPRTINQALALEQYCDLDYIFYLDIDHQELMKRLTGRWMCPKCAGIYNIHFKKPQVHGLCDNDQATLYQRADDHADAVSIRLDEYDKLTLPLIKHYETNPRFIKINANQPIEDVYKNINNYLKQNK